ncbi:hypothetical protein V6N13_061720 [Hibiscus sabdariffa]
MEYMEHEEQMDIHINQLIPARLVFEYAHVVFFDFQRVNEDVITMASSARSIRWTKHGPGHVKVNVDGAWLARDRVATTGVIVTDHNGMMLDGCTRRLEVAHNAETVDACGFEVGVHMAVENGWEHAIIEGNAMGIVNRLTTGELDCLVVASYLAEIESIGSFIETQMIDAFFDPNQSFIRALNVEKMANPNHSSEPPSVQSLSPVVHSLVIGSHMGQ